MAGLTGLVEGQGLTGRAGRSGGEAKGKGELAMPSLQGLLIWKLWLGENPKLKRPQKSQQCFHRENSSLIKVAFRLPLI